MAEAVADKNAQAIDALTVSTCLLDASIWMAVDLSAFAAYS